MTINPGLDSLKKFPRRIEQRINSPLFLAAFLITPPSIIRTSLHTFVLITIFYTYRLRNSLQLNMKSVSLAALAMLALVQAKPVPEAGKLPK